jgi:hypothetical protein
MYLYNIYNSLMCYNKYSICAIYNIYNSLMCYNKYSICAIYNIYNSLMCYNKYSICAIYNIYICICCCFFPGQPQAPVLPVSFSTALTQTTTLHDQQTTTSTSPPSRPFYSRLQHYMISRQYISIRS